MFRLDYWDDIKRVGLARPRWRNRLVGKQVLVDMKLSTQSAY